MSLHSRQLIKKGSFLQNIIVIKLAKQCYSVFSIPHAGRTHRNLSEAQHPAEIWRLRSDGLWQSHYHLAKQRFSHHSRRDHTQHVVWRHTPVDTVSVFCYSLYNTLSQFLLEFNMTDWVHSRSDEDENAGVKSAKKKSKKGSVKARIQLWLTNPQQLK